MNIVWLSWKDKKHPLAGGAETITDIILSHLARDGHAVTLLTSRPADMAAEDEINGYRVVRGGSRYGVYLNARRYFKRYLKDSAELVIEEINTIPFFSRFYVSQPRYLFFHQLARKVWFYQISAPIAQIGYVLEPLYLRLLSRQKVITISPSTKQDLLRHGFRPANVHIIREATEMKPMANLDARKYSRPTMLSLGAVRPMKRTLESVEAFNTAKASLPELELIIAGDHSGPYGQKVKQMVDASPYRTDIRLLGRVSDDERTELMQKCHVITVTSIKEGWGLIVTEANSQGTPAVVYDVDGLRDSVKNKITGLIVKPNPKALAEGVVNLLSDHDSYQKIRQSAWEDSRQYTPENCYSDFLKAASLNKPAG